ncbi:glycosyltransferase family 2 protein, partial [uncultured Sutterella sp.]|uniref:glycosyltransferase family 2 protein n=1 Tax=uncultured Sutterella sp. TaxID=286133 RepID=UPI00261DBFC2
LKIKRFQLKLEINVRQPCGAVVRHERRQGKGNVMRTMFREIDADCYVLVDGDDTYPAEAAPAMVRRVLRDHVDMVLGDRLSSTYFTENKRPFHNSGNVLVRRLINMLFLRGRKPVLDIMTGYRAFSPLFIKSFPVLSRGFEVETEMTIHALDKNLGIESMPITYRDRPEGSFSKLSTFRDGIKVLWTIFLLFKDYRPMLFFSMLSGLLLLIGLGFLWPVLEEYMRTGLVPRLPTFIAACFLALFSLLSFVCGLILDTITKKDRQNFEIDLNMLYQLGLRESGK